MQDPVVLAKARAAATWCKHATAHENAHDGKPWRYLLIPHDAIADNMSLGGLASKFTVVALEEGQEAMPGPVPPAEDREGSRAP